MKEKYIIELTGPEFDKLWEVVVNEISDAESRNDNPLHISAVRDLQRKLAKVGGLIKMEGE